MYCKYYGLKEHPFNITSDPLFFFLSEAHKEAVSHLLYGISQRKGILVITGEIGTGKTTLCRFLLNQLGENVKTAFIMNPPPSENQLLQSIAKDFGIRFKFKSNLYILWELNKFLLKESKKGNNVVLIIDEAQNLKPEVLEEIRLISNLETHKHKLIQIILVGQPELKERLSLHSLRQLQQRVIVRYDIKPLSKEEVKEYIRHRLEICGADGKLQFELNSIEAIFEFSQGIPRLINMICDRALLSGFAQEKDTIDTQTIVRCKEELGNYFNGG